MWKIIEQEKEYVVGFDISEKITFFCKENGHTNWYITYIDIKIVGEM
mgnify:CR=1